MATLTAPAVAAGPVAALYPQETAAPSPVASSDRRRKRLRRAPIWVKLAAIAVAFTIPLATTTWFLLQEQAIKIDFARNELRGVEYLRPATALLQGVLAYRSAVGSDGAGGDVGAATAAVETALTGLGEVDSRLAVPLLTQPADLAARDRADSAPSTLRATWQQVQASDADAANELLDVMVADVRALITHVGDTSLLILDPDLDTYYVMDAFLLRMPEALQVAHDLADATALAGADTDAETAIALAGSAARLELQTNALLVDLETAVREAPRFSDSTTLEGALRGPVDRVAAAATTLTTLARDVASGEPVAQAALSDALSAFQAASQDTLPALFAEEEAMLGLRLGDDRSRQRVAFIAVLAALAVSITLTVLVARRFTRNVALVAHAAEDLARGDLTRRAQVRTGDEIGAMSGSFNTMASTLQHLVAGVQRASVDVSSAAMQLSSTSEQLAATTTEQSAAVTETTATTEELARASSSIADTVDDVAAQAATTRENLAKAEAGILASSERTVALAARVREIRGILELINEIADQTNLLAVNAAIEAARAGEDGLGFAVVADEVRRLAERSKESAADIAGIVDGVQAETNATVMAMEQGATQMRAGLALLDRVGDATEQVRGTTQQQRSATAQVVETMEQLTDSSRQVSGTAQQIAEAAGVLARLAADLDDAASSVSTS